uniref:Uncharacterized protein n=1 Tax=Rhizophora mucronata TaxID=61149 RepID=A0A2P2KYB4_RHIMU
MYHKKKKKKNENINKPKAELKRSYLKCCLH